MYTLSHLQRPTVTRKEMDTVGHSAVRNRFTDINSRGGKGRRLIGA